MNQLRKIDRIEEEMGKLNQTSEPLTISHFSHLHPLHIFSPQPHYHQTLASCSGCKVKLSPGGGSIYCCSSCNFFLHASCAKLPLQITHPVDQFHALSLLPSPIYPQGFFNCDACGKRGNGFSYHCGSCNIDLHTACVSMPISRIHPSHPHQLSLTFSPPYPNKSFSCDVCRNPGTNHWLYRCHQCQFDSHLSCAAATSATNPIRNLLNNQQPGTNIPHVHQVNVQNYVTYPSTPPLIQQQYVAMNVQPQHVYMNVPMNRPNQLQGLFRGSSSQFTQALVRGFIGGGISSIAGGGGAGGGGEMSDPSGGGGDGGGFDSGGFGDMGNGGDFGDVGSIGDFDF